MRDLITDNLFVPPFFFFQTFRNICSSNKSFIGLVII